MKIGMRATWALSIALGGALLLMSTAPATAHDRGHGQKWLERLQGKLELSDDQVKAIGEIYTRDSESRRQLFQTTRQVQSDLGRLVLNGADEATIQQKTAELEGLLAQGLQMRVRRLQEIAPLLTPEQRERFAQLRPGAPWMRRSPHGRPAPGASS
jgi:Spy/CpxP family protein refolding chaperone